MIGKVSVNILQKNFGKAGWVWPKKRDIMTLKINDIVKSLDTDQVCKDEAGYIIEDDFLCMEWGE